MKKNLLYLFMLLMSVSMFTACSDDDDDMPKNEEFKAEKLKLSFNGKELTDKSVIFTQVNSTEAKIALKHLIPGEDSLIVNLDLKPAVRAYGNYALSGENKTPDRVVKVLGDFIEGVLDLKIALEITNTSILGEWNTIPYGSDQVTNAVESSLHIDIKNDKDFVFLPIWNVVVSGTDVGTNLAIAGMMIPSILTKVELTKEGRLIAYYYENLTDASEGKEPIKEDKNVTYCVNNGMIYIKADLSSVLPTNRATPTIDIMGLINGSIPFKYTITEKGDLRMYVDKGMMLPFMPFIEMIAPSLADEVNMGGIEIPKGVLSEFMIGISKIITNAEKAEIGLQVRRPAAV